MNFVSAVQMLKLRARFLLRVSFKRLLGWRFSLQIDPRSPNFFIPVILQLNIKPYIFFVIGNVFAVCDHVFISLFMDEYIHIRLILLYFCLNLILDPLDLQYDHLDRKQNR